MKYIRQVIKERFFIDPKDGKRKSRYGNRGGNEIRWIIVHYLGDAKAQGRSKQTADAMQSWKRTVSTHYIVGEDAIIQTLDEKFAAWHCPYNKNNKCEACNANAIGVDLAEHKRHPDHCSAHDADWWFSSDVIEAASQLIADLADEHRIPMDHIVRHYDVTGKVCPRPFVGKDTNEVTGEIHDVQWLVFLEKIRVKRDPNGFAR